MKRAHFLFPAALALFALESRTPSLADEGITGEVHRKYAGKIVFANQGIPKLDADTSRFKASFTTGEPIYARVFAPKCPAACTLDGKTLDPAKDVVLLAYFVKIDGKPCAGATRAYPSLNECSREHQTAARAPVKGAALTQHVCGKKADTWTTWRLYVLPSESDDQIIDRETSEFYAEFQRSIFVFADAFAAQAPGSHKVEVEARVSAAGREASVSEPLAAGEFTIEVKAGEAVKVAKRSLLPQNLYRGPNPEEMKTQALEAMKAVHKEPILDVGFAWSDFEESRYADTGVPYRWIAVWVAWDDGIQDERGDGFGRIFTYSLKAEKKSDGQWGRLVLVAGDKGPELEYPLKLLKEWK
ncbi:MAG: hypothetical protein MUC63_00185 [Planctomycetes bacterium]|nr:hypothetical protein [Planctomycetota bacterium]